MPIRSIIFFIGQVSFIYPYFYTTKVLSEKPLSLRMRLHCIGICPFAAYAYVILIIRLLNIFLSSNAVDKLICYSDFFVFIISFLLMYSYGKVMGELASAARFLYLCLYLFAMPFTVTYDSLLWTIIIDMIAPIAINIIYCRWVCRPIAALREDCDRINGILLSILVIAAGLFLLRIVGFVFINNNEDFRKYNNFFSVYSFVYATLVLAFVFSAIIIIIQISNHREQMSWQRRRVMSSPSRRLNRLYGQLMRRTAIQMVILCVWQPTRSRFQSYLVILMIRPIRCTTRHCYMMWERLVSTMQF